VNELYSRESLLALPFEFAGFVTPMVLSLEVGLTLQVS
jgi:hypothetical protein